MVFYKFYSFYLKLEKIHFPANVESLQVLAFHGCEGLKSVSFAEDSHLELLNSMCFEGCINLSQINFHWTTHFLSSIHQNAVLEPHHNVLSGQTQPFHLGYL